MSEIATQRYALNQKASKIICILTVECNKRNAGLMKYNTMNARKPLLQVWVTLNQKRYIIFALID